MEVYTYQREFRKFHEYAHSVASVKKLKNLIGNKPNHEILKAFKKEVNKPLKYNPDITATLEAAFGNQTKDICKEFDVNLVRTNTVNRRCSNLFFLHSIIKEAENMKIAESFKHTGKIEEKDFSSYVANINKLGWINCDRFRDFGPNMLANINLDYNQEGTKYYLVMKEMRSLLGPQINREKRQLSFVNLPKGQEVKIIGIKLVDNKPYIAVLNHLIQDDNDLELTFNKGSLDQIKHELNNIDNFTSS